LTDVWQPEPGHELIFNFSASPGCTTPSVFADQIEWLDRHMARRQHTCLSVHPWNDAGNGVAAAELALLAGARRVEGCLLALGERTQDICLATLGMNLRSHGVDPELDLSRMDGIRRLGEPSTRSADRGAGGQLRVADVGRVMEAVHGLDLPAGLRGEFAEVVQACTDAVGSELSADQMWDTFEREYLLRVPASALLVRCSARRANMSPADPWIAMFGIRQSIRTAHDNPALVVAGTLAAMGLDVTILSRYSQVQGTSGLTVVYVQCVAGFPAWGVGLGGDLTAACLKAVLSAVNRAELRGRRTAPHELCFVDGVETGDGS
jgi:2-isopropylmalate synthase